MKRRITAFVLAAALAVSAVGTVQAEDTVSVTEWTEENTEDFSDTAADLDCESGDAVITDDLPEDTVLPEDSETVSEDTVLSEYDESVSEDTSVPQEIFDADNTVMADGSDDFILDIQEVAEGTFASVEGEESVQTQEPETEIVTVRLAESGMASTAGLPLISLFSDGVYTDSYGDQLTGDAAYLYRQMVEKYTKNKVMEDITCNLSSKFQFHLDVTQKQIEDKSYQETEEYQDYISQLMYPIQAAYDAFLFDCPEAFWMAPPMMSFGLSRSADTQNGGYNFSVSQITLVPTEAYEGAFQDIAAFDQSVTGTVASLKSVIGNADADWADILKVLHDYLCEHLSYDHNYASYSSDSEQYRYIHSTAGVFLNKNNYAVVCDGYSKSFKLLCDLFGIPCAVIPGNAGGAHAWNLVQLEEGRWYLVDVTWDDQTSGISYVYFLANSGSVGFNGETIGTSRTAYTVFSGTEYTKSFAVPELSTEQWHTHVWAYTSNGDATCQKDGTRKAVCTVGTCTASKTVTDPGTMLDHEWNSGTVTQQPTCVSQGVKTYTCVNCRTTKTEPVAVLSHQEDSRTVTTEPTCTESGKITYRCKTCSKELRTETLPASGHTWNTVRTTDIAATCSAPGKTSIHCKNCDAVKDEETIPALPHQEDGGTVTIQPTCTETGKKVFLCTVCREILRTEEIPANGHVWNTEKTVDIPSTCTAGGVSSIHCTICNAVNPESVETLSLLEHQYGDFVVDKQPTVFESGREVAACTAPGCTAVTERAIAPLTPFISTNVTKITLQKGQSTKKVTVTMAAGDSVSSWTSKNSKIASVNKKTGKITAKRVGKTTITVKLKSGKTKKIQVTVQKNAVATTKITGIPKTLTMQKGQKKTLKAVIKPITSLQKVKWSSSNTKIVSVSTSGKLTARKKGTATITVKSGKFSVKCKVTVK